MEIIVHKYGCKLHMADGLLMIVADDFVKEVPLHRVSSIYVQKSSIISSDLIFKAIERQIDIVFTDRKGFPIGRVWSNKYGSISIIRKNQIRFADSSEAGDWVKSLIKEKIKNKSVLINGLKSQFEDKSFQQLMDSIEKAIEQIDSIEKQPIAEFAEKIRGIEGNIGRVYFKAISNCLPNQYQFKKRSQHPAKDAFNALLNYSYGMLYGKVESALIRAGLDPYTGIFHRDEYNRPVLVYDFIEYFRVWADYVVINLLMQQVIFDDFFDVKDDQWYLNKYGKAILIQSMNDYLEEVVKIRGNERSRNTHILFRCQEFASMLKTYKS